MLIKSGLLTQMSGSIGGMTGSRNAAGMYLRARAVPVNPNSPDQVAVRGIFSTLAAGWRSLTDAQRDSWANYAANTPVVNALGDTIHLSGVQWYMKVNACAARGFIGPFNSGPVASGMSVLTEPTWLVRVALNTATGTVLDTNDWAKTTGGALMQFCSRQQEPSINFYKGPFRLSSILLGDTTTPPTNTASWESPFGETFTLGKIVYIRTIAVDSGGRMTNEFIARATVVA